MYNKRYRQYDGQYINNICLWKNKNVQIKSFISAAIQRWHNARNHKSNSDRELLSTADLHSTATSPTWFVVCGLKSCNRWKGSD